jgi:EcsC protein family
LSKLAGDASAFILERGVAGAYAPAANRLVVEIASRFGIVISERVAAGALPVLGALGGATLNVLFMNHFQRIARGHFTVRRLEREYGIDAVRHYYDGLGPRRLEAES